MRWKNFDLQFRSSSATTAKVSDIRPKHAGLNKNVSSTERAILIKDAQIEKQGNQNVPIVKGYMMPFAKGVRNTKKQAFNMWSITKKHMPQLSAKTLSRSPIPQMRHSVSRPNSSLNSQQMWLYKSPSHKFATQIHSKTH